MVLFVFLKVPGQAKCICSGGAVEVHETMESGWTPSAGAIKFLGHCN